MRTVMVAHRGAQAIAPENTLSAFKLALKHGFKAMECDVQLSRDGRLVVMHDETVDRTTDGSGWVSRLTLEQLRALHIEGAERIPTLAEVVQLVVMHAKRRLIIEIKADSSLHAKRTAAALAEFVGDLPPRYRTLLEVHSFWYESLLLFGQACPFVPVAAIVNGGFTAEQIIDIAKRTGAKGISLGHEFKSSKIVRQCNRAGLFVDTWAVPDATIYKRLRPFGVHAMVETFTGKSHPAIGNPKTKVARKER